jgi:hypothetical protein
MNCAKPCLVGLVSLVLFSCSYTKTVKKSTQVDFFEKLEAATRFAQK